MGEGLQQTIGFDSIVWTTAENSYVLFEDKQALQQVKQSVNINLVVFASLSLASSLHEPNMLYNIADGLIEFGAQSMPSVRELLVCVKKRTLLEQLSASGVPVLPFKVRISVIISACAKKCCWIHFTNFAHLQSCTFACCIVCLHFLLFSNAVTEDSCEI